MLRKLGMRVSFIKPRSRSILRELQYDGASSLISMFPSGFSIVRLVSERWSRVDDRVVINSDCKDILDSEEPFVIDLKPNSLRLCAGLCSEKLCVAELYERLI